MNYVKIIQGYKDLTPAKRAENFELKANGFLKEVFEKRHRVMSSRFYEKDGWVTCYFTINDQPHPHAKGNELVE